MRHAALLHDIGRVGVPNGIWDKTRALNEGKWERVRLHPYLTERILSRSKALRPLGEIASLHHERLDGSGYHRGTSGPNVPPAARLLAAADAYQALTSDRPHRPATGPLEAGGPARSGGTRWAARPPRRAGCAHRRLGRVVSAAAERLGRPV